MILLLFSITCFIISGIILILSKTIENRERKSSSYKYTKGNIDWVPGADQWIDTDAFFELPADEDVLRYSKMTHHVKFLMNDDDE